MIIEYFTSALHVLSQARSYARKNNDLALATIHLVSCSSSSHLIKLWRRIKRSFAHSIWWPGWNPHGRNRSFGFSYASIIHTYQNILSDSINIKILTLNFIMCVFWFRYPIVVIVNIPLGIIMFPNETGYFFWKLRIFSRTGLLR